MSHYIGLTEFGLVHSYQRPVENDVVDFFRGKSRSGTIEIITNGKKN